MRLTSVGLLLCGALYAQAPGPGFVLESAGSLTSNPAEVVSGTRSIKGAYFGTNSFTPYLRTDPSILPLRRNLI